MIQPNAPYPASRKEELSSSWPTPLEKKETICESKRLIEVCNQIQSNNWTTKKFMHAFLKNPHDEIVNRRRLWATTGLNSTMDLLKEIVHIIKKNEEGREMWSNFVLEEAIHIVEGQRPPRGNYPNGCFQSSRTVSPEYLSEESKRRDIEQLTKSHTPFLYDLLIGVLSNSDDVADEGDEDSTNEEPVNFSNTDCLPEADLEEARILQLEGIQYARLSNAQRKHHRSQSFVACGVTERVNNYLLYHGLSCSQRTAMQALKTLSVCAERKIRRSFSSKLANVVAPMVCIDNIDIEQRVHTHSVGHQSRMFHGTWGYIHIPSPLTLKALNPAELTLDRFTQALQQAPSLQIEPYMFLPTPESKAHYKLVWKSQIANVMHHYIAVPNKPSEAISLTPPPIDQIPATPPPTIHMIKLMDASDNSAEGIGQVLESIAQQAGMPADKFFSRLQVMDGDLGTCRLFNSLRALRTPSAYSQHNLHNVAFQLGAAHTLWNIAQAIFKAHFGDTSNSLDTGAWQLLDALGVPADKAFPKNDFGLMIKHMERVHEATILYGLKSVPLF
ncbi:hypothetical protein PGT21_029411 [Puccinia graminis f. sp. tritici]|uniref:DUF6589 domain-containing protein n=1 Tax=Puccinia graminis f. sp. tritici TaxID=56615 RepID=A0A5B0MG39_PUCGR|nr:hypothetical protein PGT21_029411 [Puccinia graminis f. sp. tritici]